MIQLILQSFYEATLIASKRSSPISTIIPLISKLKDVLGDYEEFDFECQSIILEINNQINRYYGNIETVDDIVLSTMLDPRFLNLNEVYLTQTNVES